MGTENIMSLCLNYSYVKGGEVTGWPPLGDPIVP